MGARGSPWSLLSSWLVVLAAGGAWALEAGVTSRGGRCLERPCPPAFLVRDVQPGAEGSGAFFLTDVQGTLFFGADDGLHGRELWRSDGTASGTRLVEDIHPGSADALPIPYSSDESVLDAPVVAVGGVLYFAANDGEHGMELWRSDGTAAGTYLVEDVRPGPESSNPQSLRAVGGRVFFRADDGEHGQELWVSDGTRRGTRLVEDIRPGPDGSTDFLGEQRVSVGEVLYFAADDGEHGVELWRSDGTPAGTRLVEDIFEGADSAFPFGIVAFGSIVLFEATDREHGNELWRSDGTRAGTRLVEDIRPGPEGSFPSDMTVVGGFVIFSAVDADHGREPWRTDGTPGGTRLIEDLWPGPTGSSPARLTASGGRAFFRAMDELHGSEPWTSDGTRAGTFLLRDIVPGPGGSSPIDDETPGFIFDAVDGVLLFVAAEGQTLVLWKSDGTRRGTVRLRDISEGGSFDPFFFLTASGSHVFFSAFEANTGVELWALPRSSLDCYPGESVVPWAPDAAFNRGPAWEVEDIFPCAPGSNPDWLTDADGRLFFTADDGRHGREVWVSDGTESGTRLVEDILPGVGTGEPPPAPEFLTAVGRRVFFSADDGSSGREPWVSDGTPGGTFRVADVREGPEGSIPVALTAVGDRLFFSANDGVAGHELWVSDGTPGGTFLVADIRPGPESSEVQSMVAHEGRVFFTANDGVSGFELWVSDGTADGTRMVADIFPGSGGSFPESLTFLGDTLFFAATGTGTRGQLWRSDGTAAGTVLVADLSPGAGGRPELLVAAEDRLFFSALQDDERWLFVSDGSTAGTFRLVTLATAGERLATVGDTVFFVHFEPDTGRELWKSDGTLAGTRLVEDILRGFGSSDPRELRSEGDVLLFSAYELEGGREPWVSDGTRRGTRRLQDLAPGPSSSTPMMFTVSGGKVFFSADTPRTGRELWGVKRSDLD
ncbi:ELWxxDGT repeat protein [Pyxidicoccus xibeiensis]|uniref:ELWxxDGT repeat protein n=1 Tax=Pyxidicoccus xibeiensis TaxID=2906759 RepID=UPI0020A7FADD|nr:ELWxxDGT repeat protein [Pyxidicoccus xibeiensis]MCP3142547.1 hyalin [Pyxidicoccus xibeiensis]